MVFWLCTLKIRSYYMINYMTNYMVITCKNNGNLLVLKTYNYHELSINFCSLVLWSKQTLVLGRR